MSTSKSSPTPSPLPAAVHVYSWLSIFACVLHFPLPPLMAGYVDDIIAPRDTRKRLIADLEMLKTKKLSNPPRKHGNIPL